MSSPGSSGAGIPVVLLNDTRVDRHHGCTRVVEAIETLLAGIGATVIARAPAHSDWTADPAILKGLDRAALVIVNGEGTLHHDRPAGLKLLEAGAYARARGIAAVLVNCGWEANGPEAVRRLMDFALVSVRDSFSAADLRAFEIGHRVVPDLSLYEPYRATGAERRGLVFTDSVDQEAAVALDIARRDLGASCLPIQTSQPGIRGAWRFHREVIGRGSLRNPRFLASVIRARHAQFLNQVVSPAAFMTRLAESELLVSGRFHACTLAVATRTPFLAAGTNTRKIKALVTDAGLARWRLTAPMHDADLARARGEGWSPGERSALEGYMVRARDDADTLFRDIRGLA